MIKASFESDYTTGAHPRILERLSETNLEPLSGYGSDPYTKSAREKIRNACRTPAAEVEFLVGGTQMHIASASEPFCGAKRPRSGLHRT